jgi:lipoprotein-anchoring transpeptidase ErfK/SrfK
MLDGDRPPGPLSRLRTLRREASSRLSLRGLPTSIPLTAAALALAAVLALVGSGHDAGLLSPRSASADTAIAETPVSGTPTAGAPSTETPVAATPPAAEPRTILTARPPSSLPDGTTPLWVRLSGVPSPGAPRPTISPAVAGAWTTKGSSEYFTPVSTLEPCSTYKLTIPASIQASGHTPLGKTRTIPMQVACPSVKALQQALARQGYLPYTFHSLYGIRLPSGRESRSLAAHHAFHVPTGALVANVHGAPPLDYGQLDETTRGAITVFDAAHGIAPGEASGESDARLWRSLLAAETEGHRDPSPYTFVTVTESSPETLEVHKGNHVALSSPANTGVAGAETPTGIFPIYSRDVSTTMIGTDPDGTHYDDPDVPWVNYFNGGDAVHGYERPSYGVPQSNGCVELPIATAKTVFGMLALGDIVYITG